MEEKIFNKGFVSITLINFIVYLVYYLLMVIIAVIAHDQLHASFGQAGLAAGIYVLGTLLARLFMGKQLELFGRKAVLRYGALFYLVTTAAYFFIPNIGVLYLIRLANGFAYGMTSTATNAIVTAYIPKLRKGEGINYYGLSTSLAAAIGPFVGMILLDVTTFRTIVTIATALVLIVTIATFLVPVKNIVLSATDKIQLKQWTFHSFIESKVLFIALIAFLMGFSYSSVLTFLSSFAEQMHLMEISSFFFVVYALVITFTRPMSGRIFDAKGENYVMYPSYLSLTIGLILLALTNSGWMLLVAGGFIGLGYGTFMSNAQAIAVKLSDSHRVGIALSTYFIGLDLGLGVGPYALGTLHAVMSFQGLFITASVIPIVSAVLYWFFYRPKVAANKTVQEFN